MTLTRIVHAKEYHLAVNVGLHHGYSPVVAQGGSYDALLCSVEDELARIEVDCAVVSLDVVAAVAVARNDTTFGEVARRGTLDAGNGAD